MCGWFARCRTGGCRPIAGLGRCDRRAQGSVSLTGCIVLLGIDFWRQSPFTRRRIAVSVRRLNRPCTPGMRREGVGWRGDRQHRLTLRGSDSSGSASPARVAARGVGRWCRSGAGGAGYSTGVSTPRGGLEHAMPCPQSPFPVRTPSNFTYCQPWNSTQPARWSTDPPRGAETGTPDHPPMGQESRNLRGEPAH
jgi:hypothetical protein